MYFFSTTVRVEFVNTNKCYIGGRDSGSENHCTKVSVTIIVIIIIYISQHHKQLNRHGNKLYHHFQYNYKRSLKVKNIKNTTS